MHSGTDLLAGLTSTERLLGYDAILDVVVGELGPAITACLCCRPTATGHVPSVLVVEDERLVEYWLAGTAVERAEVPRPGRAP